MHSDRGIPKLPIIEFKSFDGEQVMNITMASPESIMGVFFNGFICGVMFLFICGGIYLYAKRK